MSRAPGCGRVMFPEHPDLTCNRDRGHPPGCCRIELLAGGYLIADTYERKALL